MAVRFLPPPTEGRQAQQSHDREDLAEVIELRSRLQPAVPAAGQSTEQPAGQRTRQPAKPRSAAPQGVAQIAQLRANTEAIQSTRERAERHCGQYAEAGAGAGAGAAPEYDGAPEYEAVSATVQVRTAAEDAVRLLARKARSSGELRRELLALGHDHGEADEVVLDCESRLYLDDLGLARVLAETLRARKRASRSQIRMKLRERLLPDGVIETALGELDEDEEHELLRAAASERARKMGGLDRQTAERRLLGFLARRGWSGERAVRVAREALDRSELRGSLRGPAAAGRSASSSRSSVRFQ